MDIDPTLSKEIAASSGSTADIVARLEALARESAMALGRVDHVTRLPNRVQFVDDFAMQSKSGGNSRLILVTLADARHFNEILRALGHAYSEDFVREGAARLVAMLPDSVQLYHVSVLSFAFFTDCPQFAEPPPIVQEIVDRFREPIRCLDIPINSKVGVGISALDEGASTPSELLRSTLAAAQDSRRSFDGWAWYDKNSDEAHRRAFRILTDLPSALAASDQLSLHYQPRICMKRGACIGAEALIRWAHPDMGNVPPAEFVALAESTALITRVTEFVVRTAAAAVSAWQREHSGIRVSVNISPKNLEEPDFVDLLLWETEAAGVDPALFELEFTEGTLAANPSLMRDQLGRLRDKGFDIAIDDFGSGYSNMSYLSLLPAKYLKIDQSFIRPLESGRKNQLLVRSIIDMAHALDYHVVAEGIESRDIYNMLSGWGCEQGQGYYMSRPLTEANFLTWLASGPVH